MSYNAAAVKQLRRWAWNIFCALSLLIFATSVTLWVRSCFIWEQVEWAKQEGPWKFVGYSIEWREGMLRLTWVRAELSGSGTVTTGWRYWRSVSTPGIGRMELDSFRQNFTTGVSYLRSLGVPLWLFLIFAVPPLVWWRQRRKRLGGGRGFPLAAEGSQAANLNARAS